MKRLVIKYNAWFSDLGVRIQFVEPFPTKTKTRHETFLCDFSVNGQLVGIEILFGMSSEGVYHIDPLSALENQNPALAKQARLTYDEEYEQLYLQFGNCHISETASLPGTLVLDNQDRLVGLEVSWKPGAVVGARGDRRAQKRVSRQTR